MYVVGDVGGHSRLRDVEDGERFAFQGRVYEAELGDGSMQVHHSGETVNRVTNTFRDRADTVVDLTVRDVASGEEGSLTGTPDHPFYVVDRDAPVELGELEPGHQLRGEGGAVLRVEAVDERADDVAVFNFEVEDVHNYHVAAEGFGGVGALVGNKAFFLRRIDSDDLSDAARVSDRGDTTRAGRNLQKHGNRDGSAFPSPSGSPEDINRQAHEVVDDILRDPGSTVQETTAGRFGEVIEVRASDGRGIRYSFTESGEPVFVHFLEP